MVRNLVSQGEYLKNGINESIFMNDDQFDITEYKVMKKSKLHFVKCQYVHFNNQIKLTYLTSHLLPLKTVLKDMDSMEGIHIFLSIIKTYLSVQDNGFLKCSHIELSYEKLFYDKENQNVLLMYVPRLIDMRKFEVEDLFKEQFIYLIERFPQTKEMETFKNHLLDTQFSLIDIFSLDICQDHQSKRVIPQSLLCLSHHSIYHLKSSFIKIGKKSDNDIVLSFNSAISRIHCQIIIENEECFLEDLRSANGTFINGKKCLPHQRQKISVGDKIRLANEEFILK